ncbi:hypothetical protein L3X38_032621 [Prunus dulcis]|uniref:Uncharacterized protein n=1 Tax=Prunus dulcis TaxID=3755 RepID=A0AAD4VEC3_PRUDU|nr:hypothetical protein L3X38_032621 [Prunus dulcis]
MTMKVYEQTTGGVTSRDPLRRSTILSALGPPLCPHDFVSGNSRATSQWVTQPGIALAPNSLNFGVPTTPKPVSSQRPRARWIRVCTYKAHHPLSIG